MNVGRCHLPKAFPDDCILYHALERWSFYNLARGAQIVLREAFTKRNIRRIKDVHEDVQQGQV